MLDFLGEVAVNDLVFGRLAALNFCVLVNHFYKLELTEVFVAIFFQYIFSSFGPSRRRGDAGSRNSLTFTKECRLTLLSELLTKITLLNHVLSNRKLTELTPALEEH